MKQRHVSHLDYLSTQIYHIFLLGIFLIISLNFSLSYPLDRIDLSSLLSGCLRVGVVGMIIGCSPRIVRSFRPSARRGASLLDPLREQRARGPEPEGEAARSAVRDQDQGQRVRHRGNQVRA